MASLAMALNEHIGINFAPAWCALGHLFRWGLMVLMYKSSDLEASSC